MLLSTFFLSLGLFLPSRKLPIPNFRADFLAVGEAVLSWGRELGGGFPHPLALPALKLDEPLGRVDGEGGEETVAVGAGVLDPTELGVNLGRVGPVSMGTAYPFVGGRVNMEIEKFACPGQMVDMSVSVDRQENLFCSCV